MSSKIIPFPSYSSAKASAMQEAIETLTRLNIPYKRTTEFQLKVGHWNFYPGRGTITRDGQNHPEKDKGLAAFLDRLQPATGAARPHKALEPSGPQELSPEPLVITISEPQTPKDGAR